MPSRIARAQPLVCAAVASLWFACCYSLFFEGLYSSDGTNYATVARNLEQGRGFLSGVVQPGLMTLAPTSARGQAYVIQAPLWPSLLAVAFRLFGASDGTVAGLCAILGVVSALLSFLLAREMSSSVSAGWLAVGLLLTNPLWMGSVMAAYNVGLQSVIIGALFLLMPRRPSRRAAVAAGLLLGAGLVTRENTIVVAGGLAVAWLVMADDGTWSPVWRRCLRLAPYLALALVIAAGFSLAESARKAAVLGRWDSPTLRMTFLYWTPEFDLGWYFIYDFAGARLDPWRYFVQHPGVLLHKVAFQVRVLFLEQTVPALMSFYYGLVPVLAPWLLSSGPPRAVGFAVLTCLLLQVLIGLPTFLHVHYFVAFLPVITPCVAASALALIARATSARARPRKFLLAALAGYALLPLALNSGALLFGRRIPTGELPITKEQARALASFILENTYPDEVVVCSHSPLMAWRTGRTILQYSGHPGYRVSDGPMWRRIAAQLPFDAIVLNSLALETGREPVPAGFEMVRTLKTAGVKAWLFRRRSASAR